MFCSCGGQIIHNTSFSKVCTHCGVETHFLTNEVPGYQQTFGVLHTPTCYSRVYRFKVLLSRTVLYSSLDYSDPVWEYLKTGSYKTVADIKYKLSKMPSKKNKKYDSLPLFCNVFLNADLEKISTDQFARGLKIFEEINRRWVQAKYKRFFSYYFLLNLILRTIGAGHYTAVTKSLICTKRQQNYRRLLGELGFILRECKDELILLL